jgi:hypothetical protein
MTTLVRFIVGVTLSTTLIASAFAFILKSLSKWETPRPEALHVKETIQTQETGRESTKVQRENAARVTALG